MRVSVMVSVRARVRGSEGEGRVRANLPPTSQLSIKALFSTPRGKPFNSVETNRSECFRTVD